MKPGDLLKMRNADNAWNPATGIASCYYTHILGILSAGSALIFISHASVFNYVRVLSKFGVCDVDYDYVELETR